MKIRTVTIAGATLVALAAVLLWSARPVQIRAQSAASTDQAVITDLVLANRILASEEVGVLNVYGHVSYRSRTNPNRFFIARNMAAGLVTANDIYESDLDGKPVSGNRSDVYAERFIDAEIYKARPDVMAIVTAETPEFVAFSVSSVPMHGDNPPPIVDIRAFNGGQRGLVSTPALGQSLAQALGRRNTVLLQGRGAVIAGATINGVVGSANGLRESMRTQLDAASLGGTITYLDFTPRPAGAAPQRGQGAGGRGAGARGNAAADPTAGDRPWNYWKFLANAELARESREPSARAPASPPDGNPDRALIDDLVLASRILSTTESGILGAYGHVSARSRTNLNHYYISTDKSPGSITAADMIENDLNSKAAVPTDKSQFQEVFIHGEIYTARPDVMAVLHAHTPELVSFGLSSVPLRPVLLGANFIGDGLPIYDIRKYTGGYPSPVGCAHCISTADLGQALAAVIGNKGASLLLGHGIAVVEASMPALVSRVHDMRLNAVIQQMALSLGGNVNYLEGSLPSANTPNPAAWEYWKQLVANK
jgi:HCOMODA/2-hydroxy-3-carboxy-muconic semialdehyde decarboxylase